MKWHYLAFRKPTALLAMLCGMLMAGGCAHTGSCSSGSCGTNSCETGSCSTAKHHHKKHGCNDVPPGALPQPNGTFVHRFQEVQADKAEADDFVIYANEWFMGGTELGPFGERHVLQIAKRLPQCGYPVVLQPDRNASLNLSRAAHITARLENLGVTDANVRVVVGDPHALDLDGNEAPRIYGQMLQNPGLNNNGYGNFGNNGFSGGFFNRGGFGGFQGFGGLGLFGGANPFGF